MIRRLLVWGFILLLAPSAAGAAADITQLSCATEPDGSDLIRVHFSVTNQILAEPLCGIFLIPEPQPPQDDCTIQELSTATGWVGVTPFGAADLFSESLANCIAPGETAEGFSAMFSRKGTCCYVAQYENLSGTLLFENEVCFDCSTVSSPSRSWGTVKGRYGD